MSHTVSILQGEQTEVLMHFVLVVIRIKQTRDNRTVNTG